MRLIVTVIQMFIVHLFDRLLKTRRPRARTGSGSRSQAWTRPTNGSGNGDTNGHTNGHANGQAVGQDNGSGAEDKNIGCTSGGAHQGYRGPAAQYVTRDPPLSFRPNTRIL